MEEKASGIKSVQPSEKEAREIVRDFMDSDKDIFEVKYNGKSFEETRPDMEFYWGPTRSDRLEAEKWRRGFEVCTDPKVQTLHKKPDGTHQAGDAILMWRKKEIGDLERKRNEEISRAHQKKDRKEYKEFAKSQRVKVIEEDF
jgi:hypothetical protein